MLCVWVYWHSNSRKSSRKYEALWCVKTSIYSKCGDQNDAFSKCLVWTQSQRITAWQDTGRVVDCVSVFVNPMLKGSVCAYQRAWWGDMYLLKSYQLFYCAVSPNHWVCVCVWCVLAWELGAVAKPCGDMFCIKTLIWKHLLSHHHREIICSVMYFWFLP